MEKITLSDLTKTGLYFGHLKSKWHPKMEQYIFEEKNGVHIINLKKTLEKLEQALDFVKDLASKQGKILFVGTKDVIKQIIKKEAERSEMPYINERWSGGTLTNFKITQSQIKQLKDLEEKKEMGYLEKYPKKERNIFLKKIENLNKRIGGLKELETLPQAIFIVDTKKEKIALKEALMKKIPVIALADTDADPSGIKYFIPGNDRTTSAVGFVCQKITEAILEGKSKLHQVTE